MAATADSKHQQFADNNGSRDPVAVLSVASSRSDSQRAKRNSQSMVAIQVAASTSNEQLQRDTQRHMPFTDANNNPTTTTTRQPTINHCHNEAATRTALLFQHHQQHYHHHRLDNNNNHHHHHHSLLTDTSNSSSGTSGGSDAGTSAAAADEQSPTPPPNYHEIPGIVPAYQGRSSGPPPSYDDVVNPNAPPPSYQSLFGQVREARKSSNGLVDLLRQLFLILIGTLGCTMIIGFLLLIPITMIMVGIFYSNECRAENIPTFLIVGGLVWIMKNFLNCYNQFKKDSSASNRPPPRRSPISSRTSTSSASASTTSTSTSSTIAQSSNGAGGLDSPASVLIVGHPHHSNQPTTTTTIRTRDESSTSSGSSSTRIRRPSLIGITSFKCESMLNYFLIVWFCAGCIVVYRIYEPDYDNPMSQSYCHRTVYLYAFWLITSAFIIMAIVLSCLCCLMASSLIK